MLRIGGTIGPVPLRLVNRMNQLDRAINQSSLRLTTGKRINSAADDPAGLVAVNALRAELTAVQSASANVQAARGVADAAGAALEQVVAQLTAIRAAALDQTDPAASQEVIDAAIDAINSLTGTTYNGKRLLDGSQGSYVSGRNNAQVESILVVEQATAGSQTVDIEVTTAAEQAVLTYQGKGGSRVQNTATFTLTGDLGAITVSVTANESLANVRDRINLESEATGVTASVSGNDLVLTSNRYGSQADVAVQVSSGTFNVTGGNGDGTANGVDAVATINGATFTADGLEFSYRTSALKFDVKLTSSFGTGTVDTMTISGGGMVFQISPTPGNRVALNLPSVHSALLGGSSGRLSEVATGGGKSLLEGDADTVVNIVDEAMAQITALQARVGAFSSQTLDSADAVLTSIEENLTDAIAAIEEADLALESSLLTRNQLLAENASASLYLASNRDANLLPLLQRVAFGV